MDTLIDSLWLAEISDSDWDATPESVKKLVKKLIERNQDIEAGNEQLSEQVNRNSQNSSQSPSQDHPKGFKKKAKVKSKRLRGGQAGHTGYQQQLYPPDQCQEIQDHYPIHCCQCGHELTGEDATPIRHQIVDIPPLKPEVIEHRFHALECPCCGVHSRAYEPEIVDGRRYGDRLCALVGVLSGEYRQSHRMVMRLFAELFEIRLSVGTIGQLRQDLSKALAAPVEQAHQYVQHQTPVGMDETSFSQGNADGNNAKGKRGWLWLIFTPLVCYFKVFLSRAQACSHEMLGAHFSGIVTSDRYGAYNWLNVEQRQVCWAHLKRDFTKIKQRSGRSQRLGTALLKEHRAVFKLWHRVRDGTLERNQFIVQIAPIRQRVKDLLSDVATCDLPKHDQSTWAKTVRTCRQLLKVEPALWTFVTVEGLEPTNNNTERAIRPAVLWRRCSYGSQSAAGSLFVGRMMTVVTSLRSQQRNVLDYLTEACRAMRQGDNPPSLLPNSIATPTS